MTLHRFAAAYAAALVCFLLLDGVWLTVIARPMYDAELGPLLADEPVVLAAAAFYLIYLGGVVHLVVRPHLETRRPRLVARDGLVLGLVCYATWDLTNLAVIEGFPPILVPVDLLWGAGLTAIVGLVSWWTVTSPRSPATP